MKLSQMRKFGECVCHKNGILSASLIVGEDGNRSVLVTLCDQHKQEPKIAEKHIEAMRSVGYPLTVVQGKALDPKED